MHRSYSPICKISHIPIVCRALRSSFAQLAELWVPSLLKLVLVKIAVVSSAGDRCMRILIAAGAPVGFPRLLPLLLETLSSKNALLRRHCMEYLTLAAAIWEQNATFDRQADAIKKAVKTGQSDADPHARKCARCLYWVLRRRPAWQRAMDALLSDMDASMQKNVKSAAAQSNELMELLTSSATLAKMDLYEPVFSGGSPISRSFQRHHGVEAFAQTARQSRDTASNRDVKSGMYKTAPAATKGPMSSSPAKIKPRMEAARVGVPLAGKSVPEVPHLPTPQGGDELKFILDDSLEDAPTSQKSSKQMSVAPTGRVQSVSALGASRRMSVGPTRLAVPSSQSKEGSDVPLTHSEPFRGAVDDLPTKPKK